MADLQRNLESPLRGESFSAEHLWNHAQELAVQHSGITRDAPGIKFVERFESNRAYISLTYKAISETVREGTPLTSDAEWILDNYYIIEEQLREIHEDLPPGFYRELPKLTEGSSAGLPRIYDLAHELITHTDSSLDEELISGFVTAYQQTTPLTTGELWAVPAMLRLVLVENLRRLCSHVMAVREHRKTAQSTLDQWENERPLPGSHGHLLESPMLVMQMIEGLREHRETPRTIAFADLLHCLGVGQESIDECIRCEQHRLTSNQISIGNLITSMRLLTSLDWTQFFERVSLVEPILRQDPAHVYEYMDFATRDYYRHQIEALAKRGKIDELTVANAALDLSMESERSEEQDPRARHIGYYLIDDGRVRLERRLRISPRLSWTIERKVRQLATWGYPAAVVVSAMVGAIFVGFLLRNAHASWPVTLLVSFFALIPASEVAVAILNALVTNLLHPRLLPKIEFKSRIPASYQTLVVIPGMLTSAQGVTALLQRLEVHYLSNPEEGLAFALLTDFADAQQESVATDRALYDQAVDGIRRLNTRYFPDEPEKFFLLHRDRKWNPEEQAWMGWERKRGKLVELNRLLRGDKNSGFRDLAGIAALPRVRYVITLDSDTRMPHGTAKRLIGTMAHPLNRAVIDRKRGHVVRGYGILQPRVAINMDSAAKSRFAAVFANNPGLDPYATAVSDVYQDLFGEGSYTGKGIYDVDAFCLCVDDVFPENQILSHDLIEGCYARSGLVTDINVFDDIPARFDAEARRQHRWVRGDWQLITRLFPQVPHDGKLKSNTLSVLSIWKVVDNLRRSLLFPCLFLFLVAGWLLVPPASVTFSLLGTFVLAVSIFTHLIVALFRKPRGVAPLSYLRTLRDDLKRGLEQCLLTISFIPFKAHLMADAIIRTLHRVFVSRKHLLEWESADATERRLSSSPSASFIQMAWVSALSLALLAATYATGGFGAWPILMLWVVSPLLGYWISLPLVNKGSVMTAADQQELRRIARKTWSYFEQFVGETDHWLPPDNCQENPELRVAHRLSPTNQGLYVVSTLAAFDFGYISIADLTDRLEKNLESLDRLEKHAGHFFNWYDTTTLSPLPPRYVSTADSGNLAISLLTAHQGVKQLLSQPLFHENRVRGLEDTVVLVERALEKRGRGKLELSEPLGWELKQSLSQLRRSLAGESGESVNWRLLFDKVEESSRLLDDQSRRITEYLGTREVELTAALMILRNHFAGLRRDRDLYLKWLPWMETIAADLRPEKKQSNPREVLLFAQNLSLERIAALPEELKDFPSSPNGDLEAEQIRQAILESAENANRLSRQLRYLSDRYESMALEMDFKSVYNPQRRLFSVGFNKDEGQLDRSHYDLLASEARLASLIAIAKGDVEHRHWFQLGRTLTEINGTKALLSWGGTMFEYLMPALFLRDFPGSLLDNSCRAAVQAQIAYGQRRNVPWGISESAYGAMASNSDYQYQSFGVPGMGLKRGLANDLVISPYSTGLALVIDPAAAVANFRKLTEEGGEGVWGYYDALDYTSERVPPDDRRIIVRNYMTHHHGMTMAGLANCLLNDWVRQRFQKIPMARTTELLLQERTPTSVLEFQPDSEDAPVIPSVTQTTGSISRRLSTYATPRPRTHLLSNGHYSVMLTNSGAGYSKCGNLAITRWRSDPTRDDWGQFIYLKRLDTGAVWSTGYQPTRAVPHAYEVTYSMDKAEFRRRDGDLETLLEVAISPEHDAEIRHVTISNHGHQAIAIEVTSYAEIVLAEPGADSSHPAFSKLFVETEYLPEFRALLAKRRPRDSTQSPIWGVHIVTGNQPADSEVQYETDREKFLGRCRSVGIPAALLPHARLTGSSGPVLDPVFSLRQTLNIRPGESASLAFVTAYAQTREEAMLLADQYHDVRSIQRTFEMAWAHSQVELRHLQISGAGMQLYQRLASALLYPDPAWRADAQLIRQNRRPQSALWKYGISGDLPIVLLQISKSEQRVLLKELLLAHEFWHARGLKVDLVVLNEYPAEYFDAVNVQLQQILQGHSRVPLNHYAGVFLLKASFVDPEDVILLKTVASIILSGEKGPLARQAETKTDPYRLSDQPPPFKQTRKEGPSTTESIAPRPLEERLEFFNGLGGFSRDGKEYLIELSGRDTTPAPWSNVIANPNFGCLVTEAGGGYTWSGNSRETKLTGWSNDPVLDRPGEVVYIRDEETGELWNPTPTPIREGTPYLIHHGQGYSRFEHQSHDIRQDLLISIAPRDEIKFACLTLENRDQRPRTLTATYFAEWVIGVSRPDTQFHVWTGWDEQSKALFSHNFYRDEVSEGQTVFLKVLGDAVSYTGDRGEFLGRNGTLERPAALKQFHLSGKTGAGIDPCGAIQIQVELAPGETREVIFLLGAGKSEDSARALLQKYSTSQSVHSAIDETLSFWNETLGQVELKTPDKSFDLLVNHWLLYQTLSCRIWGRSAFYQSGGAFGFRDQLQDVMALVGSRPEEARRHLLRAASRQFEEGDVQHWWHPPRGRGVRTRFSDDYLWLPFVTCHYVRTTGDRAILQEQIPFLTSPILAEGEEERYEQPEVSSTTGTLYEHCVRAIEHSHRYGEHNLPLMGGGDWNDGMNKIGIEGKGESVWLAWFMIVLHREFAELATQENDTSRAQSYREQADQLLKNTEEAAWDGMWYRRAYFDDGTPVGSSENEECQIDSLAQTWAVLAQADETRISQAMEAVYSRLVQEDSRLILLFTPPFDKSPQNPGYIKGYLPGIRENGGQYTHAALWTIMAATFLKQGSKAASLFNLLNPVQSATQDRIQIYRGEPYVVAADVYGVTPHTGRAGWTWYTGSASWMYRVAVEMIAGIQWRGNRIRLAPCIPAEWPEFEVTLKRGSSTWSIHFLNPDRKESGIRELRIDGNPIQGSEPEFEIIDDGATHNVEAIL